MPEPMLHPGTNDYLDFRVERKCDPRISSMYVLERYTLRRQFMHNPMGAAGRHASGVAAACGWTRVFVADAVTGVPGTFIQLYRVPLPFDAEGTLKALQQNPEFVAFREKVDHFERHFLCPLPYDPIRTYDAKDEAHVEAAMNSVMSSFSSSRDTPETAILINEFVAVEGKEEALIAAKVEFFVPKVTRDFGWRLIAAATRLNGPTGQIVQFWTMPDSNRLVLTMRGMSQDSAYRDQVLPCVAFETQQLLEPRAGQ